MKRAIFIILTLLSLSSCLSRRTLPPKLDCVVALGAHEDTTRGLLTGYNYHLLESFAGEYSLPLSIIIERQRADWMDSLLAERINLLAIPLCESDSLKDGLCCTSPVDSISVWVVRKQDKVLLDSLNNWIGRYHVSDEFEKTSLSFLKTYDPIRRANAGRQSSFLGPYDELIKHYAAELGWDWRLLAAVIYQESRFSIKARSRRGATGLMQVMPSTVGLEETELWSPDVNVKSGTAYLKVIYRHLRRIGNVRERQRLTIAAYNAGEGRIRTLRHCADSLGVFSDSWDSLQKVIPFLDGFRGVETRTYVSRVDSLYDAFCRICP